jgi:hypothetical protein
VSENGDVQQTAHLHLMSRLRVRIEGNVRKTNTAFGRFTISFAKEKQMQMFPALFLSDFSSASLSARKDVKMDVICHEILHLFVSTNLADTR